VFLLASGARVLAGLTFTIFSLTCLVVMFRFLFSSKKRSEEILP
jgi:hypothetical protein